MSNPYEEMIDDMILEAEGLALEDEEYDQTISLLSNGESDECLAESDDEEDDEDDDDDLFDDDLGEDLYD